MLAVTSYKSSRDQWLHPVPRCTENLLAKVQTNQKSQVTRQMSRERGAAREGEAVCPQIHTREGPKTTSRVPSTSGTLPKHPANEYSKKSLTHRDGNPE